MSEFLKLHVHAVHVPSGVVEAPTVQLDNRIVHLRKANHTFNSLSWGAVNAELNERIAESFLELLSKHSPETVQSGNLIGIIWVYEPVKSEDGLVTVPYAQIVLPKNTMTSYFGSELAIESEIVFFEAV